MANIELPRKILVSRKALDETVNFCKELHLKGSCLVITGEHTKEVAGKRVFSDFQNNGFLSNIQIIKDESDIPELLEKINAFDFLIGVGGGKIIDITKYISNKANMPFISIPTSPSHDGFASPRASLNLNGFKSSFEAKPPLMIIADLDIISQAPARLIASGYGDVIAKLTSVADWKLSNIKTGEPYLSYAADLGLSAAQKILDDPEHIKSDIKFLVDSLINCGISMCFTKSSRPASGSEHMFSHALDMLYPEKKSLHGEQCGIGTIIMSYLHGQDYKKIRKCLEIIGCPTNAKQLEIPEEIMIKALVKAKEINPSRYTILNQIEINESKAKNILKTVKVI